MAIPKIRKDSILSALKFIDEAIGLENDNSKIEKYKELKAMIKEEL